MMNAANPTTATIDAPSGIRRITDPRVDRAVAIVACVPFAYMTWYRLTHEAFDLPRIAFAVNFALLFVTMAARRAPVRVTPKPLYWATAFVATYWSFMTLGFMEQGVQLAPVVVTHGLALVSLVIAIASRVSLGRNIGFVPAQREIVTAGAYRYLRHPIYAGLFITIFGVVLRAYSPRNVTLMGMHVALMMIKSVVEERFLSADPQYAAYLQKVKNRWIPFVL